jgi:hypothetical protein
VSKARREQLKLPALPVVDQFEISLAPHFSAVMPAGGILVNRFNGFLE